MTIESDNLIHDKSKVNLRSEIAAFLGAHIAVIRGYFGEVTALAAYRDQALYEALYHCGDAMGAAIEQPDVFKTIADAGGAKGRDIPTRFIDLATALAAMTRRAVFQPPPSRFPQNGSVLVLTRLPSACKTRRSSPPAQRVFSPRRL